MKTFFKKLHLWLSLPLGIVISILCLSGASLVFEQEITRALHPHLYQAEPPPGAQPLLPSQLAEHIREQMPDSLQLTSIQFSSDPRATCMVSFKQSGRKLLSIDPYTGQVNGWTKNPAFFQVMRKLHRWLMNPPLSKGEKSVGKVIVGVTTLLLVIILISGIIIWIPRNRKALKYRLRVSCKNGWQRFWYDSHVVLGFYATVFLLIMALTGLTWSFSWYRTAAYSLFGGGLQQHTAPQNPAAENTRQERQGTHNGKAPENRWHTSGYLIWDQVIQELKTQYPIYKTITLNEKSAQIIPQSNSSLRRADTALFNPEDGKIKKIIHYRDIPRSQSLRGWFYAFHTGTWGGIGTKILYFLAALTGGILPLTGYYLWLKKKYKS